jgi:hypothetical protein
MNGEYVKMWEKSIVAYFKVLSSPLCGEIEENHKQKNKTSAKKASNLAKIKTGHIPNTSLKYYLYFNIYH